MVIREKHSVESLSEPVRFIDYCIGLFPHFPTRNAVKKGIKRNELLLNDEIPSTGVWLNPGDVIAHVDPGNELPKPYHISIPIEMEEDVFLIVNKPAGLVVSGNQYRTLENALVDKVKLSSRPDALKWSQPVHRIDWATRGLVVFAKTRSAQTSLMQQFENRTVEKRYHAVLIGELKEKRVVSDLIDDKEAISELVPILSVPSLRNGTLTLVRLIPKTGRTHQLRIHCAKIGHPIVGDTLYGEKGGVLLHKGLFLAATDIAFFHPETEVPIHVQMEVPQKFHRFMMREKRRWERYHTNDSDPHQK